MRNFNGHLTNRLKRFGRIATHCEKRANNNLALIHIGMPLVGL